MTESGSIQSVNTHQPIWVGSIIPEPFEWCTVPDGNVYLHLIGQRPLHPPTLVPAFQIARYPITNAQFAAFIEDAKGWNDPVWWHFSKEAKRWRKQNPEPRPPFFKDCPECPRECVNWYTAVAFTRWLSERTGEPITLPTREQWQRAAQGDDGRNFAWGSSWEENRCKSSVPREASKATTPVRAYPQGSSPFGLFDMTGNVWEWCLDTYETRSTELTGNDRRIFKGGSWWTEDASDLLTSWEYPDTPDSAYYSRGFRIVRGT